MQSLDILTKNIPAKSYPAIVISMSGKKFLEDQLFSMFSFYYNVGIPTSWILYNDGTYADEELKILMTLPNVEIRNIHVEKFPDAVRRFPTLMKLSVLSRIKPEGPVIYTDSDILFFSSFADSVSPFIGRNCYLVDESAGFFDGHLPLNVPVDFPLNLGLMILNSVPDWNYVWEYVEERIKNGQLTYWSDQTACHLMAVRCKFIPLPPENFIVKGNDSFTLKHSADYRHAALRHFVGPVRHKMWQLNWKSVLHQH